MSQFLLDEDISDYSGSSFQAILAPDLPAFDQRGWPTGTKYKSFITSRSARKGVGSSIPGLKCGRRHEYMSLLERRLHYVLELNSRYVDIREQYPFYEYSKMVWLLEKYKRLPRNKVPTLDILATFRLSPHRFGYTGFSVKPRDKLNQPATWRRIFRERKFCADMGWGWKLVVDKSTDGCMSTETQNNPEDLSSSWWRQCRRVCGFAVRTDAHKHLLTAYRLARFVEANAADSSTLDGLMSSAGLYLHCSRRFAYRLFGVAAILGKLDFDKECEIAPGKPLVLIRR